MKDTVDFLWPTKIFAREIPQDDCAVHNHHLEKLVVDACEGGNSEKGERRIFDLDKSIQHPSLAWLSQKIDGAVRDYIKPFPVGDLEIGLRGVVLDKGSFISSHSERGESDVGVAYWPSGGKHFINTDIFQNGDKITSPTFKIEDPSRHFADLRYPWESIHSISICPRPGLLVIFPSHLLHNFHPYMGEAPFVHIVAQVTIPWPEEYLRSRR